MLEAERISGGLHNHSAQWAPFNKVFVSLLSPLIAESNLTHESFTTVAGGTRKGTQKILKHSAPTNFSRTELNGFVMNPAGAWRSNPVGSRKNTEETLNNVDLFNDCIGLVFISIDGGFLKVLLHEAFGFSGGYFGVSLKHRILMRLGFGEYQAIPWQHFYGLIDNLKRIFAGTLLISFKICRETFLIVFLSFYCRKKERFVFGILLEWFSHLQSEKFFKDSNFFEENSREEKARDSSERERDSLVSLRGGDSLGDWVGATEKRGKEERDCISAACPLHLGVHHLVAFLCRSGPRRWWPVKSTVSANETPDENPKRNPKRNCWNRWRCWDTSSIITRLAFPLPPPPFSRSIAPFNFNRHQMDLVPWLPYPPPP